MIRSPEKSSLTTMILFPPKVCYVIRGNHTTIDIFYGTDPLIFFGQFIVLGQEKQSVKSLPAIPAENQKTVEEMAVRQIALAVLMMKTGSLLLEKRSAMNLEKTISTF